MVIVSLTTTSKRLELLRISLLSLINQSVMPDCIWVWVSKEGYLSDEGIPDVAKLEREFVDITSATEVRVEFRVTENTGPYRKLLPALRACGESDLLIPADDDIFYGKQWLSLLLGAYRSHGRLPVAGRARSVVKTKWGALKGYMTWPLIREPSRVSENVLITFGAGAVLKRSFFVEGFAENDSFKELAPTADDIWYTHALLSNNSEVYIEPSVSGQLYFIRHPLGLLETYNHVHSISSRGLGFVVRVVNWAKRQLGIPTTKNDRCYRDVAAYYKEMR